MSQSILTNAMSNACGTELGTMTQCIEGEKAHVQAKEENQTCIIIKITLVIPHEKCILKSKAEGRHAEDVAEAMPECTAACNVRELVVIMATPKWTFCRISTESRSSAPLVAGGPEVREH